MVKSGTKPAKSPHAVKGKPAARAGRASYIGSVEAMADKSAKGGRPAKLRMVRDSFTMPEHEYAQIAELKKKCLQAGVHVKKSELLRAGLALLSGLQDGALLKTVDRVERIKTGRPAKN